MTRKTFAIEYFDLYTDDLDCELCLHFRGKRKKYKNGCWEETCRYENVRRACIESGKIKRPRGD